MIMHRWMTKSVGFGGDGMDNPSVTTRYGVLEGGDEFRVHGIEKERDGGITLTCP